MLQQMYEDNIMLYSHVFEVQKERVEMKDDFRSEKPSTCRTEVNVQWVKQMVCGDDRLTIRKLTGREKCLEDLEYVWKVIGLGVQSIGQFLAERVIAVLE